MVDGEFGGAPNNSGMPAIPLGMRDRKQ